MIEVRQRSSATGGWKNTYRDRLDSRFSASEKASISDDFFVALCQVADDEVSVMCQSPHGPRSAVVNLRKDLIQLEVQHLEYEPSKSPAEARIDPIVRGLGLLELSRDDDAPKLPSPLRHHNEDKSPAASSLQRELLVVQERSEHVS